MPDRRLSQAPTHPQRRVSLGTTLSVRNASFLGTIPTVPNLLRTTAAFGSHDTVADRESRHWGMKSSCRR
jgi:hypothetical protein